MSLQPFFLAHSEADGGKPATALPFGSSQPSEITASAVPWKMMIGIGPVLHPARSAMVPPECGPTPLMSARSQPMWCEKYPPMEKPVAKTCASSRHWSCNTSAFMASMSAKSVAAFMLFTKFPKPHTVAPLSETFHGDSDD